MRHIGMKSPDEAVEELRTVPYLPQSEISWKLKLHSCYRLEDIAQNFISNFRIKNPRIVATMISNHD